MAQFVRRDCSQQPRQISAGLTARFLDAIEEDVAILPDSPFVQKGQAENQIGRRLPRRNNVQDKLAGARRPLTGVFQLSRRSKTIDPCDGNSGGTKDSGCLEF
jgi:hypothetical protein